jgi:hypothetical protein
VGIIFLLSAIVFGISGIVCSNKKLKHLKLIENFKNIDCIKNTENLDSIKKMEDRELFENIKLLNNLFCRLGKKTTIIKIILNSLDNLLEEINNRINKRKDNNEQSENTKSSFSTPNKFFQEINPIHLKNRYVNTIVALIETTNPLSKYSNKLKNIDNILLKEYLILCDLLKNFNFDPIWDITLYLPSFSFCLNRINNLQSPNKERIAKILNEAKLNEIVKKFFSALENRKTDYSCTNNNCSTNCCTYTKFKTSLENFEKINS